MCGAIPPLPQYLLMDKCLIKHRDDSALNLTCDQSVPTGDLLCKRKWKRTLWHTVLGKKVCVLKATKIL
jgi:hypothetical protein